MPEEPDELLSLIAEGRTRDNYRIEYGSHAPSPDGKKYAAVYFSSIAVYFPETAAVFRKKIIEQDNYEWFHTRVPYAEKHIFVRDIAQKLYLTGINDRIDSFDKLVDLLRRETEGYQVITVGSSLGGFLAATTGLRLKAHTIFDFCGSFYLERYDDLKKKNIDVLDHRDFFDIRQACRDNRDSAFFYMTSSLSPFDLDQMQQVADCDRIHFAIIRTAKHGVPVFKNILTRILAAPSAELNKIYVHPVAAPVSEFTFIRRHWGWFGVIARTFSYLKRHPGAIWEKDFYRFFSA